MRMKKQLKYIPFIGPLGKRVITELRHISRVLRNKEKQAYVFERITPQVSGDRSYASQQIFNLLNYTKTSGSAYNGKEFSAGYHSFAIQDLSFSGQRKPADRLSQVPYDFAGKAVLDIGCNQGGMLYSLADKIAHGIGIDYDKRVINVANRIRSHIKSHNLDFYVFDLENDPLDLIGDLLPGGKVDIVFLLSICMWISNWKQVIDHASKIGDAMLFESNGKAEQQAEQIAYLRTRYKKVELLSGQSADDKIQKKRQLYLCQ
jgi:SAM-dependent methyltransferase